MASDAWRSWQDAPWGRIRYRIVAETLRRTVADLVTDLGSGPVRVLDVGGGDGGDAVPLAVLGHDVTVLDPSERMLADAGERARTAGVRLTTVAGDVDHAAELGVFDLVLAHNVIQYVPSAPAFVDALGRAVGPRGVLSVIAVNPPSDVLVTLIRSSDPEAALTMVGAPTVRNVTFGSEVRRVSRDEGEAALHDAGLDMVARYGIRCVTDLVADEDRKLDPHFYDALERLELALCDREPFISTARMWQLVARRR